jgi:hypothetical protein
MGIVKYIKLDQLTAKDKKDLKKILQKQKKALQEAINLAERSGEPEHVRRRLISPARR